ncbi:MAG: thioredoxin family protein [Alphaproteobacteria bacterium]|nr:thioredoxin family protein [Alphaproteobacteria bacterium]OJV15769.1 MAG: hypothetical protein BGO27_07630 [Alphaproteobacteria bacterium 33-17]
MRIFYLFISLLMLVNIAKAEEVLTAVMYNKSSIIEVKPAKGWKVYYKNPGSFGEPMQIYQGNQEISFISSPPDRISTMKFEEFAYTGKFYIKPIFSENSNDQALILQYTACNKICVAGKAEVANLDEILTEAEIPAYAELPKVKDYNITLNIKNNLQIVSDYDDIIFSDPGMITRKEGGKIYLLLNPEMQKGKEALIKNDGKYEVITIALNGNIEVLEDKVYVPTLSIIAMAFLGGLILNIMPCVLPVLFLKIWGIVKYNNISRRHILATIAGIFSFFIIIAGLSMSFKALGNELGWGIQFQNKYYVIFLMLITLVFGLSFFGIIKLPQKIIEIKTKYEFAEHYLMGVLACLLATPCTAPFLGSVLGYTISLGYFENILIYLFIFVGFAFPYFIMLIKPKLLLFMQNLGMYSKIINKILGTALIITSLWLFIVLLYQLDIIENKENNWMKFTQEKLKEELEDHNLVFVDITAKWCLTCQFNKVRVLDTEEIRDIFATHNVKLFRGNYNIQSTDIEDYLHKNGRKGIPFNALYDKKGKIYIFSEVLDADTIKKKVEQFSSH